MTWKDTEWFVCVALGSAPAVTAFMWHAWELHILPRRIPREEIQDLADHVMRCYPHEPEHWAYVEEDAAWRRR